MEMLGNKQSGSLLISIDLPASSVPTTVDTQILEDTFSTFYGSLGAIVINSVAVSGDAAETVAVIDATITIEGVDVNYVNTYTYTQNI